MVQNFDKRVLGQDVFIDVAHKPSDGAAAKILKLAVENGRLRALVEWTSFGVSAVKDRGFHYLSAEFHEQWTDNEKKLQHGCVLLGAGLTIRPVIKNLDPVQLSVDDDHDAAPRVCISPALLAELTKSLSTETNMDKYLKLLAAALAAIGFKTDATQKPFADSAKIQLEAVKDDDAKCLAVVETSRRARRRVRRDQEAVGRRTCRRTSRSRWRQPSGGNVDIAGEITKALAARDTAAQTAKTTLEGKLKLLTDTLAAEKSLTPEGVTKLAADVRRWSPRPRPTTRSSARHAAAEELERLSAATKLATLGFRTPSGSVHITVDSGNQIKALQAEVDKRLGLTKKKDSRRFERTGGELLPANEEFAEKVLAQYDAMHGAAADERAQGAGGRRGQRERRGGAADRGAHRHPRGAVRPHEPGAHGRGHRAVRQRHRRAVQLPRHDCGRRERPAPLRAAGHPQGRHDPDDRRDAADPAEAGVPAVSRKSRTCCRPRRSTTTRSRRTCAT
jgi:hypothetical protein